MPLDKTEKKLFAQLDDPMPGQQANALALLRARFEKQTPPMTFRQLGEDLASAISPQDHDAVKSQLAAALHANKGLALRYQMAQAQLTGIKMALSISRYWRKAAACVTLPVIGLVAYELLTRDPAAVRAATDEGFQRIAALTVWSNAKQDSTPVVRVAGHSDYWVIARSDQNDEHASAEGQAVTVHCVHLFAGKAEADAGAYRKPHPYALWGWGWLTWPEVATDCRQASAVPPPKFKFGER